jgi:dolichol-phosphate mannosyltransferase
MPLTERILNAIKTLHKYSFEVLFVDDGSRDETLGEIEKLISQGVPIGYIKLSRNFGHQGALEAGIAHCANSVDAIITMDGDLQHPPEEIKRMLEAFESGADVVQMRRKNVAENFQGVLSLGFYTFFKYVSDAPLVPNAADFRLISKKVALEILKIPGKGKLLRALIPIIGFKQVHLEYIQEKRRHGKPSYSFFALYELAMHTIFKFSRFPANFCTMGGAFLFLLGITLLFLNLLSVLPANPYTFFIPLLLTFMGVLLALTGIICWYLYFILEQVRHDPSYIVDEFVCPPTIKAP